MMTDQNIQFIKSIIICNAVALVLGISFIAIIKIANSKGHAIKLPVSNGLLLLILQYFVTVTAITVVPLPFSYHVKSPHQSLNIIPIVNTAKDLLDTTRGRDRYLASDTLENIMGNIVMFLPLSILLPLISGKLAFAKRVIAVAFFCSLGIELTQYAGRFFGMYRQVDIDDVILNTMGAATGFFIYRAWVQKRRKPM